MENKDSTDPLVEIARKSLSPEQAEEYKRIGEHMYNTETYKIKEIGSQVRIAKDEELVIYATEALKSGGDPLDLSDEELRALEKVYGNTWYTRFDLKENEIRLPVVQLVTSEEAKKDKPTHSRQQRRLLQRKKDRKTGKK